jgi:hypothetical protein
VINRLHLFRKIPTFVIEREIVKFSFEFVPPNDFHFQFLFHLPELVIFLHIDVIGISFHLELFMFLGNLSLYLSKLMINTQHEGIWVCVSTCDGPTLEYVALQCDTFAA